MTDFYADDFDKETKSFLYKKKQRPETFTRTNHAGLKQLVFGKKKKGENNG